MVIAPHLRWPEFENPPKRIMSPLFVKVPVDVMGPDVIGPVFRLALEILLDAISEPDLITILPVLHNVPIDVIGPHSTHWPIAENVPVVHIAPVYKLLEFDKTPMLHNVPVELICSVICNVFADTCPVTVNDAASM